MAKWREILSTHLPGLLLLPTQDYLRDASASCDVSKVLCGKTWDPLFGNRPDIQRTFQPCLALQRTRSRRSPVQTKLSLYRLWGLEAKRL